MKKLVLVAVFVMGFSVMTMAQDLPAYEFFTGYSYLRWAPIGASGDLQGGEIAVAFNKNKHAAIVGDFTGNYGKISGRNINVHSALFGPKVMMPYGRYTPFVQALFGVYHVNLGGMRKRDTENDFGYALGLGMDVEVNQFISVRPFQAEYVGVRSAGIIQSDMRVSAGAVFKLGKKF
jgi:hypothetical protein